MLEIQNGENWEKLLYVDNSKASRRLVLSVGDTKTNALRVVLKEENLAGGICEIRVYNELPQTIETIRRANKTMNEPDEKVLLPWEK